MCIKKYLCMLKSVKTTSHVSLVNAIKDIMQEQYPNNSVQYDESESDADIFITKKDSNNVIKIHIQTQNITINDEDIAEIINQYNETVYNQDSSVEYDADKLLFKIIE